MSDTPAVEICDLSYSYGTNAALQSVSMSVQQGEIFALLGPNGGGKTTLFRILSTQMLPGRGTARILGFDVAKQTSRVRRCIGVVFQAPSLDRKLTAAENLMHQGHLHGLRGAELNRRIQQVLDSVKLTSRAHERIERFSGGMQRRVEIAKSLLHRPKVLLLDEPSTGLDPGARRDMWDELVEFRNTLGVTSLITTHLIEEAEQADRVAIIHRGHIVASGSPEMLKSTVNGEVLELVSREPKKLRGLIAEKFGGDPLVIGEDTVRIETDHLSEIPGARLLVAIIEAFPGYVETGRVGKPTLEDVFIRCTGYRFSNAMAESFVG